MFIQGLKMAAAKPMVPSFSAAPAMPEAMPPFWIPTSNATERADGLSNPAARATQYPSV